MANKTIIQFDDGQLTNSDYFLIWDIETGTNRKVKTSDILSNISGTTINGISGSSITLKTDNITDVGQTNKYVSSDQISKINIIKSDQPTNTYLAGDGQYREITTTTADDLTYNNISARDGDIGNIPENKRVLVLDASGDPTVDAGAALYYKNDQGSFTKLAENESLDINFSSGTSYAFGNGLTESAGVVTLGGTLTGDTYIDRDSNNFIVSDFININNITGNSNTIFSDQAILNGNCNLLTGRGGTSTNIQSNKNIIAGDSNNSFCLNSSLLIGSTNSISCNTNSIVFGSSNTINKNDTGSLGTSNILGGANNDLSVANSFVLTNTSIIDGNFIHATGLDNLVTGTTSFSIVSGRENTIKNSDYSTILGGRNNTIDVGLTGTTIIGGENINLTASTYGDHTVVSNLAIHSTPTNGSSGDTVLVRDASTGIIRQIPQSSLSSSGGTGGGTSYTFGDGLSESGGVVSYTGATPIITSVGNGLTNTSGVISLGGNINQNVTLNGYRGISVGYGNTLSTTKANPISLGYCSRSNGHHSISSGRYAYADGNYGTVLGGYFSGAYASFSSVIGSENSRVSAAHGAIIGGKNNTICSGNIRAAIIGGENINLTGTTYINTTAVNNLAIMSSPTTGTTAVSGESVLVRDASTGIIKQIPQQPEQPIYSAGGIIVQDGRLVLGGNLSATDVNINTLGQDFVMSRNGFIDDAFDSFIFGGNDSSISDANNVTIIGGDNIDVSGTSYNDYTLMSNLAIMATPTNGVSADNVLVRDAATGKIKQVTQASLASSGGTGGATSFSGLTDTSFSAVTDGDIVKYNGTSWINENIDDSFATPIDKAASEDLTQSIDFSLATIQPKTHSGTTTITGITNSELGTIVLVITGGDDVTIDSGVIPAERIRGAFDNTKTTNVLKITNYDAINEDYFATWELVGGSSGGASSYLELSKTTSQAVSTTVSDITSFDGATLIDGSNGDITYNATTGVFTLPANTTYKVSLKVDYQAGSSTVRSTIDVLLTDTEATPNELAAGYNYIRDNGDKNTIGFGKTIVVGGTPLDIKLRHKLSKGNNATITLIKAVIDIAVR